MRAHRSASICPVANALDLVGDRWTLLVVRDMVFMGKRTFADFLSSNEGIATNILADRLRRLRGSGLVVRTGGGRGVAYRLTERGADLIPVLLELIAWSQRHVPGVANPPEMRRRLARDRAGLARDLRASLAPLPTPRCDLPGPPARVRAAARTAGPVTRRRRTMLAAAAQSASRGKAQPK